MGQRGKYFRAQGSGHLAFYCPGCKHLHGIVIDTSKPCHWEFNHNYECPTFKPSVRHFTKEEGGGETTICHYIITDGNIAFCGDCQHELSGKTVPMPELPTQYRDDHKGELR